MTAPCRWVIDDDLPFGKFLVPGCWNRVVHGDDAECQCKTPDQQEPLQDQIDRLQAEIEQMKRNAR